MALDKHSALQEQRFSLPRMVIWLMDMEYFSLQSLISKVISNSLLKVLGLTIWVCRSCDNHIRLIDFTSSENIPIMSTSSSWSKQGISKKKEKTDNAYYGCSTGGYVDSLTVQTVGGIFIKTAQVYRKERDLNHYCTKETECKRWGWLPLSLFKNRSRRKEGISDCIKFCG